MNTATKRQSDSPALSYWQTMSNKWEASGLPQPEFCKQNSISYPKFTYWRSKLLSAAGQSRPQLKQVKLVAASGQDGSRQAIRVLFPNGVSVWIPAHMPEATIKNVLNGLSSC
jgi:hypothetical protein